MADVQRSADSRRRRIDRVDRLARRGPIEAVRAVFLKNLDSDYEEGMQYGMIGYFVPYSVFPAGYHCSPDQPLPFAALASQKGYMSVYLMCIYAHEAHRSWFEQAWAKAGKKLDMGKSCVRFKKIEDVPLAVVGEAIRRVPAKKYVEHYLKALSRMDRAVARRIRSKILGLARDPLAPNNNVKKLVGVEGYRLRVGDWRVVYVLERKVLTVVVVRIGHRSEVYK